MITWVHDSDSDQLVFRSDDSKVVHWVASKIGLVTSTKLPIKEVFQSREQLQAWAVNLEETKGITVDEILASPDEKGL